MTARANGKTKEEAPAALLALCRAAKRALERGIATGTPVYVLEGNRIIDIAKKRRRSNVPKRKSRD